MSALHPKATDAYLKRFHFARGQRQTFRQTASGTLRHVIDPFYSLYIRPKLHPAYPIQDGALTRESSKKV